MLPSKPTRSGLETNNPSLHQTQYGPEGLNRRVRTLTSRACGFHSAEAVAAMIMLCCGPVDLQLPHDKHSINDR